MFCLWRSFNPFANIGIFKIFILYRILILSQTIVSRMVVIGGFVKMVANKNYTSVAAKTFISDTEPVSSIVDLSLVTVNKAIMDEKRCATLASNEWPNRLFQLNATISIECGKIQVHQF